MYRTRIFESPERSFFLFGPRGSGKSTWIRHSVNAVKTFDLLSEELYQRLLVSPGAFAAELRVIEAGSWVVVDEIQRIPALLNEVHRFIEERQLRFVLSGSSARKLKQAGVNLLAGRAVRRYMHPFVPEEIGDSFSMDGALRFGTLPIVWDQADDMGREETLRAYAQLYLKEEIQAEALVRDLPAFARFLPVAALCHGQTINVSSLARDAGVARTTVAGYLGILEDTLLCFQLAGYEPRLRVKERKHPKLYWADPGIVRAVRGGLTPPLADERGALFEGLVAQLLRAYRDYRGAFDEMFYWSPTSSQTEVDFVLLRGGEAIAIEVKSGERFSQKWCRGVRAIASLPNLCRRIVVCPAGETMQTEDGVDILPFRALAESLGSDTLWP